uniref:PX core protein n=1 Tax=Psittacine aviadenovirus B TaxID=2169709 RepID=A0AB38ZPB6_9ADEN
MSSTILLSGSGARRRRTTRKRQIRLPKLPRAGRRKARPAIVPTVSATASERAALQSLAQRLQRGNFSAWRSANYTPPAAQEAAKLAAQTGAPATATDLLTGTTASAAPLGGTGSRRRRKPSARSRRPRSRLSGGFLPALIPIIAAAIGAIPGIAGTAVGIASLKEQQRQFNRLYGKAK